MPPSLHPLSPLIGVEVRGVDLSAALDDPVFEAIRSGWLGHKVVLFRGQRIEEEDMLRFGGRLGELQVHVRNDSASTRHREVLLVTNKKENGKAIGVLGDAEAPWHIDQIYMRFPTFGTMLFGVTIPPEGGNTHVCDLATAYERLPADVKKRIDGKRAISSAAHFNRTTNAGMTKEQLERVPDVSHPLVRTHPVLGTRSLFMSHAHTMRIEGCSDAESDALLDLLRKHTVNPEFIYEHRWQVGDVLMWDNTQTMHRRDPFDPDQIRLLRRISFMYPPEHRTPV
jgi:taurine dioxygenase